MRSMLHAVALAAVVALAVAAPASALTVIAPTDGAEVGSRPDFTLDADAGGDSLTVEVSRSPDLLTSGYRAGWFVDPVENSVRFFDHPPLNTVRWGTGRLDAGRYYWRSLIETYDGAAPVWSPVLTLTVVDEPVIFEGWTLRAERLRRRGSCSRVRLRGTVAIDDNDRTPRVVGTLTVRAGGRVVARSRWTPRYATPDAVPFDRIVCVGARRFTVGATVTDRGGHAVATPRRSIST